MANISTEWSDAFVAKHSLSTLDDLVYLVSHQDWEKEIEELVNQVPSLARSRIVIARFRSAFEIGREALKQAAAPASKAFDPDEPLPESTFQSLNQDWQRRYNLQLEPAMEPSEALRSRLYREFKKSQLTVIEARKIKSVIALAQPKVHETVSLGDKIHLEFDKETGITIRSTVEYYLQLRVLAHAMAWAGNYQVDYEGSKHWMMDLSTALSYADGALRDCMDYGSGSLIWISRSDVLTRGKMASYVRRGYPASVALKQAWKDCHLEWRAPIAVPAVRTGSPAGASPAKRKLADPPAAEPPRRRLKTDAHQTISMVKGGRRICKMWNDGRGCSNGSCADLHGCDVKLPSGKPYALAT